MAKLTKVWVESVDFGLHRKRHSLRLDWDNDRHQAVHLDSLEPEDVEAGLVRASIELRRERHLKKI